MNRYLPFAIIACFFLLIKLSGLGIRLSDTNIYFYTGYQLLQGKMLYKDIFFTNLPLFPYISGIYALLTGGNLTFYYFTAAVEAVITGFLIYVIVIRQYRNTLLASLCSLLYLFSFMLLSTTDHQTGVFLASLFAVTSYYFYTEKKLLLSGICIALTLLIKAYFLPILLTYVIILLIQPHKKTEKGKPLAHILSSIHAGQMIHFSVGFAVTMLIVLLPTFLFAQRDFIRDVFEYSLTRSGGIPKIRIFWFFITHDLLITTSLIYSLIMIRKYTFFGVLSVLGLIFFILYKDIYYLYLNFLLPFLSIAFANLYSDLEKRLKLQQMVLLTIFAVCLMINLVIYLGGYRDLQRIHNIDQLVSTIKSINPPYLYGGNGVTPALAYLTDTPLVNPSVDMNANIFRKGFLNTEKLTREALENNAIFVGEGIDYPQFQVFQPITDEVIAIEQLQKNKCALVTTIPIKTEGPQNRINLITCE